MFNRRLTKRQKAIVNQANAKKGDLVQCTSNIRRYHNENWVNISRIWEILWISNATKRIGLREVIDEHQQQAIRLNQRPGMQIITLDWVDAFGGFIEYKPAKLLKEEDLPAPMSKK